MKRKILLIALMLLALIILVSCNSCSSSSGQEFTNEVSYVLPQDTVYMKARVNDSINLYLMMSTQEMQENQEDPQELIIVKKIEPMQVDTAWKVKNSAEFNKLEKTEKIIKEQSRTIDSLMSIKKK